MNTSKQPPAISSYQVGIFALVQKENDFLLVRPHHLLLPGGPKSLPGTLVPDIGTGTGIVENLLRTILLSHVSISVGEFRLVGSHTLSAGELSRLPRLNLIFGTEYCSGILNPNPSELQSALWVPRHQLREAPAWLRSAIQQMSPPNISMEDTQASAKSFLGWPRVANS